MDKEQTAQVAGDDRRVAQDLANRIQKNLDLIDSCAGDEADQAPEDRSPGFANALMCEAPDSIEKAADVKTLDWRLIGKALQHYAGCADARAA